MRVLALVMFACLASAVDAPPSILEAASATAVGDTGTVALAVSAADDGPADELIYEWRRTDGPGPEPLFARNHSNAARTVEATVFAAGRHRFAVTVVDRANRVVFGNAEVVIAARPVAIGLQPWSQTVARGATVSFFAYGTDQFGNWTSLPWLQWTAEEGLSPSSYSFIADRVGGPYRVTATGAGLTASGLVTVTEPGQSDAPVIEDLQIVYGADGRSAEVQVSARDDLGEEGLTYSWSPGMYSQDWMVSATGTNAAKEVRFTFAHAGTFTAGLTVANRNGLVAWRQVSFEIAAIPTRIEVSATGDVVMVGRSIEFGAGVRDQFDRWIPADQAPAWSVDGGGGTIAADGRFTPDGSQPTVRVRAERLGLVGESTVRVVAAPRFAGPSTATVDGRTIHLRVPPASYVLGEERLAYVWEAVQAPAFVGVQSSGAVRQEAFAGINAAGKYVFRVTARDGDGVAVSQDCVVEVAAVPTAITVWPTDATVEPRRRLQLQANVLDQFGMPLARQPRFRWRSDGGSVSANGLFVAGSRLGATSVTAAARGLSGETRVFVARGVPTVARPAVASPAVVEGGTTTELSVLGADRDGERALRYDWSVVSSTSDGVTFSRNGGNDAKRTTATFPRCGWYQLRATIRDAGGLSAISEVLVEVRPGMTGIGVQPPDTIVTAGGQTQFIAIRLDQYGQGFGEALTSEAAWSVSGGGEIADGLFTAGEMAGGPHVVSAVFADHSASTTLRIVAPPIGPTIVSGPSVVRIDERTFEVALEADDDGGRDHLAYTWSVDGSGYDAISFPDPQDQSRARVVLGVARAHLVEVAVWDQEGNYALANVTLEIEQRLTALRMTPSSVRLAAGASRRFEVFPLDQFGNYYFSELSLAWSATGGGHVAADGTFVADGAEGSWLVKASTGGVEGVAAVRVLSAMPQLIGTPSVVFEPGFTAAQVAVVVEDDGGADALRYAWRPLSGPSEMTFSAVDAAATRVSFMVPGDYRIAVDVTDADGQTLTVPVTVALAPMPSAIAIEPAHAEWPTGAGGTYTARFLDQLGKPLYVAPGMIAEAWSVSGGGTIEAAVYTNEYDEVLLQYGSFASGEAPGGPFTVGLDAGGIHGETTFTLYGPPLPTGVN